MNALDRAIAAARAEAPPRLDPARARRMVDVALDAAAAPAPRRWRWPAIVATPLLAAAAVLVVWLAGSGARSVERAAVAVVPTALSLPTGDWIATTPGAQLDLSDASTANRQIRLTSGTALFDVRPLAAGEQFVVKTPDLEARVVGTVFTVEVGPGSTSVRVYEGRVRARRGGVEHDLAIGEMLGPNGIRSTLTNDPLGDLAVGRARARLATAPAKPEQPPRSTMPWPTPATTQAPVLEPASPAPIPDPSIREPATSTQTTSTATSTPARASVATRGRAKPSSSSSTATEPTRAHAMALLAARKFVEARDLAVQNSWHVIEGDADRGLGDHVAAVRAYAAAADSPHADDVCIGALLAAQLSADRLGDLEKALSFAERAASSTCATRERALGLTIAVANRAGARDTATTAARQYLAEFPTGSYAAAARATLTTTRHP
ncbi:MAG: FecR domain-containing protein [Kofleriaceae bacterium]